MHEVKQVWIYAIIPWMIWLLVAFSEGGHTNFFHLLITTCPFVCGCFITLTNSDANHVYSFFISVTRSLSKKLSEEPFKVPYPVAATSSAPPDEVCDSVWLINIIYFTVFICTLQVKIVHVTLILLSGSIYWGNP